ncbi:hypothetical protein [Rheinheimera gaetbuli]
MRWLSSLAILIMLSLWCTPQAFAVHDSRLSPLADTRLHALLPQLQDALNADNEDNTDQPQTYLASSFRYPLPHYRVNAKQHDNVVSQASFLSHVRPRAPPLFTSH